MKSNFLTLPIWFYICTVSLLAGCQTDSQTVSSDRSPPAPAITSSPSVASPVVAKTSPPAQTSSPIGVNLALITYYGTDYPFINVFKTASRWRTICARKDRGCDRDRLAQQQKLLQLDRYGWVKSLPSEEDSSQDTRVRSFLFSNADSSYVDGEYIVSYKGKGKIAYGGGAKLISSQPGRDLIRVDVSKKRGIWLDILSTDPQTQGNYIRDIVVVKRENVDKLKTQIFNPDFLKKLQGFKVIRFMDWMNANKSQERDWDRRTLPETATYMQVSAPVEVMVALSNQARISPWFNMPHAVGDEYIANFAKLVKRDLNPELKVYLEHSNEVWNDSFPQGKWIQEQAKKLWAAPQYPQSGFAKRMNWHGKRTAEICEIWKKVFSDRPQSIVCVLGTHMSNPRTSIQALECPLWSEKPCYKHQIDALGVAAYFGRYIGIPKYQQQVDTWSVDRVFQEINSGTGLDEKRSQGALADLRAKMATNFELANRRNLKLFAYEGGQHLIGTNRVAHDQTITNLFVTANRDPRMAGVYETLWQDWKKAGGSDFIFYSFVGPATKWGSWGLLESLGQPTSPKYETVKNLIQNNR